MLGLEFFKKALELQRKYAPPDVRIENDLQTNGMLLDDAWCEFLRSNRFLVGLSIDGPGYLHNAYRVGPDGQPSHERALKAAHLLIKHGVRFNTLTAVNRLTGRHPLGVFYRFLRDVVKSKYMQFIPIVERKSRRTIAPQCWDEPGLPKMGTQQALPGGRDSIVTEWSVDPDDYGSFLCKIFDEWYASDMGRVFVYHFESALGQWAGMDGAICTLSGVCGKSLVVEHDGEVFACDHYVYPEYRLGNIKDQSLAAMAFSERQAEFGLRKSHGLPAYCR